MKNTKTALNLLVVALLAACGSDETEGSGTDIEIGGTWETSFANGDDNMVVITDSSWSDPFLDVEIVEYDNDSNTAITQNPSDPPEMVTPDVYNFLVWTEPTEDSFSYCIAAFNVATLEDARAVTADPDPADLEAGCGGFPWTTLIAP